MTEPLTRQRISDVVDPLGWRLILGVAVTHVRVPTLAAAAEAAAVAISTDGIIVDGEELDIALEYTPGDRVIEAEIGDALLIVKIARASAGFRLTTRGASHRARVLPAHVAPFAKHLIEKIPPDLSKFLLAPMPGLLMRLDVAAGDKVEAGQPLAVVEAMKMENILRAEKSGRVKSINAVPGDSLAVDAVILEME